MAITSSGSSGNAVFAPATPTNVWNGVFNLGGILNGDSGVIVVSGENIATVDGSSNTYSFTFTGGAAAMNGSLVKIGEYTNAGTGANTSCTVAAWTFRNTSGSTIGTVNFTMNFTGNIDDASLSVQEFGSSAALVLDGAVSANATDASNGYGSATLAGLANVEHLFVRALAKKFNATGQLTPTTGYTAFDVARSRNNATEAVITRGEYRILTATGDTSNPTHALAGDTAGLYFALKEDVAPPPSSVQMIFAAYGA